MKNYFVMQCLWRTDERSTPWQYRYMQSMSAVERCTDVHTNNHAFSNLTAGSPALGAELNTTEKSKTMQSTWSLAELGKQYGSLVWNTYWGIYFGALGGLFAGVQTGVLNPLKLVGGNNHQTVSEYAVAFLKRHVRVSRYAPYVQSHPAAANFLISFLIAEASEPLRIGATVIAVPVIARQRSPKTKQDED
ncbi:expressed unknown protein [Seminavis robusta]|uniref:Uncharacterized protein n=1 Tax=Seminavis robusta TaxID=568900 RepID=A0A9N8E0M3_9STRA|nr:expressed unknown protein [Seminavis robusta]|eukprot:Sro417_g138790.1 n/a (191) ;mRNA; r:57016-57588